MPIPPGPTPHPHIHIRIREPYRKPRRLAYSRKAAMAAYGAAGQPARSVVWTINLTDDEELHRLNRQFRGIDKPTDVLSFSGERYRDGKLKPHTLTLPTVPGEIEFLGDIAISMDRCTEQAQAAGHPVETELALLVIHGTLHLLGYDHGSKTRKARMWSAQSRALRSIGISLEVE